MFVNADTIGISTLFLRASLGVTRCCESPDGLQVLCFGRRVLQWNPDNINKTALEGGAYQKKSAYRRILIGLTLSRKTVEKFSR